MNRENLIGPHQITFDITNKCNLRCLHCYNSSGENLQSKEELTDEEVLNFISEFENIRLLNFCFCGGEPLLRKDLIVKSIKKLKVYGCQNIAMVSNGFFLNENILDELIYVGLTKIQISLDGFKASSHNYIRNNDMAYDAAIKAIKLISKKTIESSVAFTPTSYNISELKDVKSFISDLGLKNTLRVQPVMIMGRAAENILNIVPNKFQYRELVNLIKELNAEGGNVSIDWGDPIDHLIRFTKKDLIITNSIIRSNGEIVADPYIPIVVGNLRKHKFMEYWEAGLFNIWSEKIIKKIAENILTTNDMNMVDNEYIPKVFKNGDIYLDLIDTPKNQFDNLLSSFNINI